MKTQWVKYLLPGSDFIKMTLPSTMYVDGIVITGRKDSEQYIKSFYIKYTDSNGVEQTIFEPGVITNPKYFRTNLETKVTTSFNPDDYSFIIFDTTISASSITIYPNGKSKFYGDVFVNQMSIRCDVILAEAPIRTLAPTDTPTKIKLSNGITYTIANVSDINRTYETHSVNLNFSRLDSKTGWVRNRDSSTGSIVGVGADSVKMILPSVMKVFGVVITGRFDLLQYVKLFEVLYTDSNGIYQYINPSDSHYFPTNLGSTIPEEKTMSSKSR